VYPHPEALDYFPFGLQTRPIFPVALPLSSKQKRVGFCREVREHEVSSLAISVHRQVWQLSQGFNSTTLLLLNKTQIAFMLRRLAVSPRVCVFPIGSITDDKIAQNKHYLLGIFAIVVSVVKPW
jgi:hypothetical protein